MEISWKNVLEARESYEVWHLWRVGKPIFSNNTEALEEKFKLLL